MTADLKVKLIMGRERLGFTSKQPPDTSCRLFSFINKASYADVLHRSPFYDFAILIAGLYASNFTLNRP